MSPAVQQVQTGSDKQGRDSTLLSGMSVVARGKRNIDFHIQHHNTCVWGVVSSCSDSPTNIEAELQKELSQGRG